MDRCLDAAVLGFATLVARYWNERQERPPPKELLERVVRVAGFAPTSARGSEGNL
jgi:hypothetical protein